MQFTQHVVFYAADEERVTSFIKDWQTDASAAPAGFLGGRLLRFRDKPGRYVLQTDFDSWESSEVSRGRPETAESMKKLLEITDGEPKYENLDVLLDF